MGKSLPLGGLQFAGESRGELPIGDQVGSYADFLSSRNMYGYGSQAGLLGEPEPREFAALAEHQTAVNLNHKSVAGASARGLLGEAA